MEIQTIQRKLFYVLERGCEVTIVFDENFLLQFKDGELKTTSNEDPFSVTIGLDAEGAYLRDAKVKDSLTAMYVNEKLDKVGQSELRISHAFFQKNIFRLKLEKKPELRALKSGFYLEFPEMDDLENPGMIALGIECCAR